MDKFVLVAGITGVILFIVALATLINAVLGAIRSKTKLGRFLTGILVALVVGAFASSLIYFSLFLQTFMRYTHEEMIGWVYAEEHDGSIRTTFYHAPENRMHFVNIVGDQWMIEGYFLRWKTALRWLGADAHYRLTRLSGRWERSDRTTVSNYEIHPDEKIWRFLLRNAEKIPGVDTAYGIAAFQYPGPDTFYVYINDTGFILRRQ